MAKRWDVIVIGSGFGGAVTACRLAGSAQSVLVLERGRRWRVEDYPRRPGDAWIYDPERPESENGWLDLRFFDDMIVAQGAGVGGGSLIYANVSVEAPRVAFQSGWPPEITYQEIEPHYETVGRMLGVQTLPANQRTRRWKLVEEGARALGHLDRFHSLPLAVTFDPAFSYDRDDPLDHRHSRSWTNAQGRPQGTCVHLGECDLGCPVQAKNTLDLNYLAHAEGNGAEVRPLHVARRIEPEDGAYRVHFDRIERGGREPGSALGERVILAAGSLGSTELLLRCRDEYHTLPRLSRRLGYGWSSNGDFLTPAFHPDREIRPSEGPTITAAIDYLDGSEEHQRFYVEDGGFPDLLERYLETKVATGARRRTFRPVIEALREELRRSPPLRNVMPWFAQGIDAADGRLRLQRRLLSPWRRTLALDWDIEASKAVIDAIVSMHTRLAQATGGRAWVPPTWSLLRNLITPHPLGGCNMASSAQGGVVDHKGQVFGYERLYVLDGSIVPRAIGRNPSRTIAALAERAAALIGRER